MVQTGDAVMLFDFGPGCYHRMMQAGVRAVDVTHVFLATSITTIAWITSDC